MLTALIIGHKGQDGTYLSQLLRAKGYSVIGVGNPATNSGTPGLEFKVDIGRPEEIQSLLADIQPHEIYYLAAFHHSSERVDLSDGELVSNSIAVNTLSLNNLLSGVLAKSPGSRVFYAASSRVFGEAASALQNEDTPFRPTCPYGISKAAGVQLCGYYRQVRGIYAAAGILYNHESALRPVKFISKRIARSAVRIARGATEKLMLGDLGTMVDWGYAPNYTRAMWQILQLAQPSDFVIGTGILHSVRDFVEAAFSPLGLDWRNHVEENPALLNHTRSRSALCADSSKLRDATGWQPDVDFRQMVRIIVDAEKVANDD